MKRRTFLSLMGAAALTSSMMLTGCGAGSGDDRKIVRIGHVQSQTHPDHLGLEAFANYINEKLGDKYRVEVYPSELLGSQTEMVQLTQTGAIDFVVASTAIISFFNTDEIFAVASMQEGTLGRRYLWGLALIPYLGWSGGTLIGAAAASLLPDRVASAFGIAIYGMFLAIIVPPAKHSRAVLGVVALSVAMSSLFQWLPALKGISAGFVIIICAVAASALGALLRPVEQEERWPEAGEECAP